MKSIVAAILASAFLVACGKKEEAPVAQEPTPAPAAAPATEAAPAAAPAASEPAKTEAPKQ